MRVLYVYPDVSSSFSHTFHYGLGYLGAVLKNAGHEVELIHAKSELSRKSFTAKVQEYNPDLVAITATTPQFPFAERYAQWVKEVSSCSVICGGVHPTLAPDEVISNPAFDVICLGEGEQPLLEYVHALSQGNQGFDIENLWFKSDGRIIKNKMRPLRQDLDTLPFPYRKFDSEIGVSRVGDIMAGRGCPYKCTYCCNHRFKELHGKSGSYVRYRSVENVLQEIEGLITCYQVTSLDFHDDTFTLKRKWLSEFCNQYSSRFSLPFVCNGRPETLKRDVLLMLKEAGCKMVRIGVESGNERIRKEVLGRNISNDDLRRVFNDAKDLGLQTSAFNMMGVPGETFANLEETIEFNKELDPSRAVVSVFYPYPLTRLHDECLQSGMISNRGKYSHTDLGTTLNLPLLSEQQINCAVKQFRAVFYKNQVATRSPQIVWLYKSLETLFGTIAAREIWIKGRWCGFRLKELQHKLHTRR